MSHPALRHVLMLADFDLGGHGDNTPTPQRCWSVLLQQVGSDLCSKREYRSSKIWKPISQTHEGIQATQNADNGKIRSLGGGSTESRGDQQPLILHLPRMDQRHRLIQFSKPVGQHVGAQGAWGKGTFRSVSTVVGKINMSGVGH